MHWLFWVAQDGLMATHKITDFFHKAKESPTPTTEAASSEPLVDQCANCLSDDGSPPRKRPTIDEGDISCAVGKSLSDEDRYNFISKKFNHLGYVFPRSQHKTHRRSFQAQWLTDYPGLTYSPKQDEAFCLPCVLFNSSPERGSLVTSGLSNWKDARTVLDGHFKDIRKDKTKRARGYQGHMLSMERYHQFLRVYQDGKANVVVQIQKDTQKKIENNKKILSSVFRSILFCGKQGIALRGHRDDNQHTTESDEANCGNFDALIKFRAESGDSHLASHLQAHSRNASYLSKTIQNDCIEVVGESILSQITEEIKQAKYFSVSADEVQDLSNKEQLAICLCYVNTKDEIKEVFVGFMDVSGDTTGERLSETIKTYLLGIGLNLDNLRGQCYDGAGNMCGAFKGVGPRIQRQYPKALHFWCASHQLNRAIVGPCQIPQVRNMMCIADKVARFFNYSSKRQKCLENTFDQQPDPVTCQKLKELCRTRWTERHVAFEVFVDLYEMIVETLETISTDQSFTTSSPGDARSLLLAVTEFQFVVTLVVVKECLGYLKQLSTVLQSRNLDVVSGFQHIETVRTALEQVRSDIDIHHEEWFQKAVEKASNVGTQPSLPRTCKRQTKRANAPASSPSDYHKLNMTIPLVDHILSEMNTRFSSLCKSSLMTLRLIPPLTDVSASDLTFYDCDLPSPSNLPQELHLWKCLWSKSSPDEQVDTALGALQACNKEHFPNIHTLLRIACTLPVTSCECERSFSSLRRLKTFTRTTMGESRLNSLAMMYMHRSRADKCNVNEMVSAFARKKPRKMAL